VRSIRRSSSPAARGWGCAARIAIAVASTPPRIWPVAGSRTRSRPFGTDTPAVQGPGFGDLQGGATLAGGVCAALFHRERTGEPTIVDSSLLAQAMWAIAPAICAADFFNIEGIRGHRPDWPSIHS